MTPQRAIDRVSTTLTGALKEVEKRWGSTASTPAARRRLTVNQQVAAFARMSEADHKALELAKGKPEYDRYVSAMIKLTGRR